MSLFSKFENIFGGGVSASKTPTVLDEKIAAAALMCEVASLDGSFDPLEEQKILKLLEEKLGFDKAEAGELFETAKKMQEESNQLLYFTRQIKEHYDEKGRLHIMELLWEVVFADGVEDDYESNLMRRLAGLLYVSDKDSGIIRKRVKERQSL